MPKPIEFWGPFQDSLLLNEVWFLNVSLLLVSCLELNLELRNVEGIRSLLTSQSTKLTLGHIDHLLSSQIVKYVVIVEQISSSL